MLSVAYDLLTNVSKELDKEVESRKSLANKAELDAIAAMDKFFRTLEAPNDNYIPLSAILTKLEHWRSLRRKQGMLEDISRQLNSLADLARKEGV